MAQGFMTRDDFTAELSLNLGGRTVSPERLIRWMNFSLLNLSSFVVLDDLRRTTALTLAIDSKTINMPSVDVLGIIDIEVNEVKLSKMRRQFVYKDVTKATPSHYLRRQAEIVVWPESDKAYTGILDYIETPPLFTTGTQKTTLIPIWDVALMMLATHHGYLSLGEQEQADNWLGRFLGYVGSRMKEEDVGTDIPKGGLNVAHSFEDIIGTPPQYGS